MLTYSYLFQYIYIYFLVQGSYNWVTLGYQIRVSPGILVPSGKFSQIKWKCLFCFLYFFELNKSACWEYFTAQISVPALLSNSVCESTHQTGTESIRNSALWEQRQTGTTEIFYILALSINPNLNSTLILTISTINYESN